jgi:hypothetical protein
LGIGFQDETWCSRFAQPHLHAWSVTDKPLRLIEQVQHSFPNTGYQLSICIYIEYSNQQGNAQGKGAGTARLIGALW